MAQKAFHMTSKEYGFSISVVAFEDSANAVESFAKSFNSNMVLSKECPRTSYLFKIKDDKFVYAVVDVGMEKSVEILSSQLKNKATYFQYENHVHAYRNSIYLKGKLIDDWIFDDAKFKKSDFKVVQKESKGSMAARYNGSVSLKPKEILDVDSAMDVIYEAHGIVVPSLSKFPGNDKKVKYEFIYSILPLDGVNPKIKQFMEMVGKMPDGPGKDNFKKMIETMLGKK